MGKWTQATIGDLVMLQRGVDLPTSERSPGVVPVIGSFGVTGQHSKAICKGPGVTVGRSGASAGTVCYVREDFWPLNTCLYVKDFKGNHPRFAYYYLKTVDLAGLNSGSAQPSLNRNFIHPIPASFPEPSEQHAIAAALGALDDKIELNQQANETLEAMARAVFRDWFVDFGPTRSKMEGREPYLAPDLWALFPDRLDEEGKPEGWRYDSVYSITGVIYGAPFASSLFNTAGVGIPLIRIRDLGSEIPSVSTPECHPKGYKVQPGDIVVGMDGEFRAHLWGGGEAWLNQRVCVFAPKPGYSSPFVRNSIIGQLMEVEATETATTVIHLGKADIDRFVAVIPSQDELAAYNSMCQPLYDLIVKNKAESRSLASLRDLLIPKLISGEIRVKDAEDMVGEVA